MWTVRHDVQGGDGSRQFFRLELGGGLRLRQEVFYLAYHLHWPWSEIMALEVGERRGYVRMLADRIETDNQALTAMAGKIGR